jgi:Na+-driven multidrug efflux pump
MDEGNPKLVGRYLRLSVICFAIGALSLVLIWGLCSKPTILWFGFDEETARIGRSYAVPYMFNRTLYGIDMCLQKFLVFHGYENYCLVSQAIQFSTQAVLVLFLAGVAGSRSLPAIGWWQAFGMLAFASANFSLVVSRGWLKSYWGGSFDVQALKVRFGNIFSPTHHGCFDFKWIL